jgi:SAM-dependent methyltransferase
LLRIWAVLAFLASRPARPVIVDLGCGDFNVGAHFVNFAREYYACDIVPELLTQNRQHFAKQNLYFSCINIIEDELPDGDIVFIRQVFQHLGNAQITKVMDKCRKYMTWVVTEHLPAGDSFTPNIDMSAGCGIRVLVNNSGIVLTAPPFNMLGYKSEILCEIPNRGGIIRTTIFEKVAA